MAKRGFNSLSNAEKACLKRIGDHIRKARIQKNLSLQQVGTRIDRSRQMISYIELGETAATAHTYKRIADVLDIPLNELLNVRFG